MFVYPSVPDEELDKRFKAGLKHSIIMLRENYLDSVLRDSININFHNLVQHILSNASLNVQKRTGEQPLLPPWQKLALHLPNHKASP
jgi:hypothetical protein